MLDNSPFINFVDHKDYVQNKEYTKFSLFEYCLSYIPRKFTITTQNGAYKFNIELLKDSCSTIRKLLEKDPKCVQYHIDIYDENNIMKKIEDLYKFKAVLFNYKDFEFVRQITEILQLTNCPPFMKLRNEYQSQLYIPFQTLIKMKENDLKIYLDKKDRFTIVFNDKEYECNLFAVNISEVIRENLEKNPKTTKYIYNLDDNEFDFTIIQDLFNFNTIEINVNNMNALKKVAENLQIKPLILVVNEFIKAYGNSIQLIDDKMTLINTIDSLFEWLYNIKEITVEKVAENIIKSKWTKSKDDISELISFILQIVRTRLLLHPYLINLIILIDKLTKEKYNFISCFIKRLKFSLSESNLYCSFMYRLFKKGLVKMEEILDYICDFINKTDTSDFYNIKYIISWFYPEIIERMNTTKEKFFSKYSEFKENRFIYNYSIDEYMKIRDIGEPNDDITSVILHDDIDKLQSIIIELKLDINNFIIPRNIYEVFYTQSLINYSAEWGSLKCFKYLFLNDADIDDSTFSLAIFGGNTEIIRILDQKGHNSHLDFSNDKFNEYFNYLQDPILCAIVTHQNNLFDWLLENDDSNNNSLNRIYFSIKNGNIHSFTSFIDKGFVDSVLNSEYLEINEMPLKTASKEGFYRYMLFLQYFYKKTYNTLREYKNLDYAVSAGNFSIFQLVISLNLTLNINASLEVAIQKEYDDIFYYIVDNFYNHFNMKNFLNVWLEASKRKTAKYFNYLNNKLSLNDLLIKYGFKLPDFLNILNGCIFQANVELVHKLTEFILVNYSNPNFTVQFNNALNCHSEEICQYFIDKKVTVSISKIISNSNLINTAGGKIALYLINEIKNEEIKYEYLQNSLNLALKNGVKNTAETFLNLVKPNFDSLISAIQSHDLSTLDLVLKFNSKPSFINQTSHFGSALNIAAFEGDAEIVKRLLALPNINPNLYDNCHVTPVMVAITRFNVEILNIFIDYFGDEIQNQMWQFNDGLKKIFHRLSRETSLKLKQRGQSHTFIRKNKYKLYEKRWSNFISNNSKSISDTIHRLIKIENINLKCHVKRYTLVTYACESNDIDLLKCLIDTNKVDVNSKCPSDGNTPLMVAIDRSNIECAEMLIKHPQTNINLKNHKNKTALVLAVARNLETIITLLINDPKFDPVESCLDYSFYISNLNIAKILYNAKSLNVNYINSYPNNKPHKLNHGHFVAYNISNLYDFYYEYNCKIKAFPYESILVRAVRINQLELIDMIINHPSFDPVKSQLNEAIFLSVTENSTQIYEYLFKQISNDVNIYNERGQSLLFYTIICENRYFLNKILSNDTFDPQKSDLFDTFMKITDLQKIARIDFMNDLLNYDENHSHLIKFNELLPNGKSFFTSINPNLDNIQDLVQYYLNHGVDPNSPDRFGVYPLEYAIGCDSPNFVNALLNSNRIDVSIRLKGNQTFFHLAATKSYVVDIFCNGNLIDINAKDDLGETPLMKACFTFNEKIWISFFNKDDLDYKHRNNKGEDALDIVRNNFLCVGDHFRFNIGNLKIETPEEKNNYFNQMINFI